MGCLPPPAAAAAAAVVCLFVAVLLLSPVLNLPIFPSLCLTVVGSGSHSFVIRNRKWSSCATFSASLSRRRKI